MGLHVRDQIIVKTQKNIYSLYDIEMYHVLQNLEKGNMVLSLPSSWFDEELENDLLSFLEREVSLQYVKSNNLFIPLDQTEIHQNFLKIRNAFNDQSWQNFLRTWDISEKRITLFFERQWRFRQFIREHLPTRSKIDDPKTIEHYQKYKDERFAGKPYFEIKNDVKEDLIKETRTDEFRRWIGNELKRNKIQRMTLKKELSESP